MLFAFVLLVVSATAQTAEISAGSGVVIGTEGVILTNSHVVEACAEINVRFPTGNAQKAKLVARDEKNDLAVVRAQRPDIFPSSVAIFREGSPIRAGDRIVALGYPLSGLLATTANLTVGNVSALAGLLDDSRYMQISAPVQPGNSGGPLLDASGHVVGIVKSKLNALHVARSFGDIPQNVNFAIKAEVARTFLDSKGITYQAARSEQQLSPADVGEIARSFTVYIECKQDQVRSVSAPTLSSPRRSNEPSQEQTENWCAGEGNPSTDLRINSCTSLIQVGRAGRVPDKLLAYAFQSRGFAYGVKKDYDLAIADFTEAMRLNPEIAKVKVWLPQIFILRGNAHSSKHDYDRAIADYTQAIRLNPNEADSFYFRASAYYYRRDYERAIADFTQAIRLRPTHDGAISARGLTYYHMKQYDRAIADLSEAIRLNPSDGGAVVLRNRAYFDKLYPQ
jgi:tetratricopeptide (TPR) repeat protein